MTSTKYVIEYKLEGKGRWHRSNGQHSSISEANSSIRRNFDDVKNKEFRTRIVQIYQRERVVK